MCLSSAGRVVSIDGADAMVDVQGTLRRVSLAVLALEHRTPEPGTWVLIHTGLAVEIIGEAEAVELGAMLAQVQGSEPSQETVE